MVQTLAWPVTCTYPRRLQWIPRSRASENMKEELGAGPPGSRVRSASVRAQGSEAGHMCPCGRGPGLCSHCPSDVRVLLRRPSGLRTCGLLGSPAKVDMAAIPVRGKGLQQGLLGVSRAWGQRGSRGGSLEEAGGGHPLWEGSSHPLEDGLRWCWLGWECCGGTDWGVGPGLAEGLPGPSSWLLGARVWVTEGFWMPCITL